MNNHQFQLAVMLSLGPKLTCRLPENLTYPSSSRKFEKSIKLP